MNREVGMEITIGELLRVVFRHWAILVIAAVLCAAAGGAFGYLRSSSSNGSQEVTTQSETREQELYDENLEMTDQYLPLSKEAMLQFRREWLRLGRVSRDNPLMQIEADSAEWENIVIQFENGSGNHKGLVSGWIQSANDNEVFGDEVQKLAPYKTDLFYIDDQEGETTVQAINVEGWDSAAAAEYLGDWFEQQSIQDGIGPVRVITTHAKGHLKFIEDFRVNLSNMLNLMMGSITNANSIVAAFPAPVPPTTTSGSGVSIKSVVKYVVAGFVLGLILGVCIVMFRLLRRGCIISRRQVESTFDLELLGDMTGGKESVAIMNASLDVMVGDEGRVMLLGIGEGVDAAAATSGWNGEGCREFVAGRDLIDDPETIDELQDVAGIVFAIRIGESRVMDINRLMLRAGKLQKKVLGWVSV